MCCWRPKKPKGKGGSKSKEVQASSVGVANPSANPNSSTGEAALPDKLSCFRKNMLQSRDEQKTIMIGPLAQVSYNPHKPEEKEFFATPAAAPTPVSTPATAMKVPSVVQTPIGEQKKVVTSAVPKPRTETTATDTPDKGKRRSATNKTADTQADSVGQCKEISKPMVTEQAVEPPKPVVPPVTPTAKVPPVKEKKRAPIDKKINSPAAGTGLSLETGGALISTDGGGGAGHEEPEIFENMQLGSSTMRLQSLQGQLGPGSLQKSAQKSVGKEAVIGFPDNLSDENENDGEKLYNAGAPATASGIVSKLREDGQAPTNLNSRITRKSGGGGKRRSRDEDTLRDVPRVLPERDYDEFLPPIVEEKVKKKLSKTVREHTNTKQEHPFSGETQEDDKGKKNSAAAKKKEPDEDKTPPSRSEIEGNT